MELFKAEMVYYQLRSMGWLVIIIVLNPVVVKLALNGFNRFGHSF